jgi:hypothetical protein
MKRISSIVLLLLTGTATAQSYIRVPFLSKPQTIPALQRASSRVCADFRSQIGIDTEGLHNSQTFLRFDAVPDSPGEFRGRIFVECTYIVHDQISARRLQELYTPDLIEVKVRRDDPFDRSLVSLPSISAAQLVQALRLYYKRGS